MDRWREKQQAKALKLTQKAQEARQEIENLLQHALDEGVTFEWKSLRKGDAFPESPPTQPSPEVVPPKPDAADPPFLPKLTLFDLFVSSWRLKKVEDARQRFNAAVRQWEVNAKAIGEGNAASGELHRQMLAEWQVRKDKFLLLQNLYNALVEARKIAYAEKQVDVVTEYCKRVLSASSYPDCFSGKWEVEYRQENRLLTVKSNLPALDALPSLKEVKYVQSKDDFNETYISDAQAKQQYASALYKVALRTLYELFKADYVDALSSIVFNGWVKSTDKATGNDTNDCVLSIEASKDEFLKINLAQVDPKACFKNMKGVSWEISPAAREINFLKEVNKAVDPSLLPFKLKNVLTGKDIEKNEEVDWNIDGTYYFSAWFDNKGAQIIWLKWGLYSRDKKCDPLLFHKICGEVIQELRDKDSSISINDKIYKLNTEDGYLGFETSERLDFSELNKPDKAKYVADQIISSSQKLWPVFQKNLSKADHL